MREHNGVESERASIAVQRAPHEARDCRSLNCQWVYFTPSILTPILTYPYDPLSLTKIYFPYTKISLFVIPFARGQCFFKSRNTSMWQQKQFTYTYKGIHFGCLFDLGKVSKGAYSEQILIHIKLIIQIEQRLTETHIACCCCLLISGTKGDLPSYSKKRAYVSSLT